MPIAVFTVPVPCHVVRSDEICVCPIFKWVKDGLPDSNTGNGYLGDMSCRLSAFGHEVTYHRGIITGAQYNRSG